jgi:hypothetical protein
MKHYKVVLLKQGMRTEQQEYAVLQVNNRTYSNDLITVGYKDPKLEFADPTGLFLNKEESRSLGELLLKLSDEKGVA